jgi:hypothetical protein
MGKHIVRHDLSKHRPIKISFLYVQFILHLLSCFLIHWIPSSKIKPVSSPNCRKVCVNGCMLFGDDDISRQPAVKILHVKKVVLITMVTLAAIKMLSVGKQVAKILANTKTRNMVRYRHNYESINGVYKDCFDDAAYKVFSQDLDRIFDDEDDVAMTLFVDSFRTDKSNTGDRMTIVSLLN